MNKDADMRTFDADDAIVQFCVMAIMCDAASDAPLPVVPDEILDALQEPVDEEEEDVDSADAGQVPFPCMAMDASLSAALHERVRSFVDGMAAAKGGPHPLSALHLSMHTARALCRLVTPASSQSVAAFGIMALARAVTPLDVTPHDSPSNVVRAPTKPAASRAFGLPSQLWFDVDDKWSQQGGEEMLVGGGAGTLCGTPWQFAWDISTSYAGERVQLLARACGVHTALLERQHAWKAAFPEAFGVVTGTAAPSTADARKDGYWPQLHVASNDVLVALVDAAAVVASSSSAPAAAAEDGAGAQPAAPRMNMNPLQLALALQQQREGGAGE